MIRKIIIPVRGDGKGANVFTHAAALAKPFKAQIVVTHCRARPEDILPFGVPVPAFMRKQLISQALKLADQEEKGLEACGRYLRGKTGYRPQSWGKHTKIGAVSYRSSGNDVPNGQSSSKHTWRKNLHCLELLN